MLFVQLKFFCHLKKILSPGLEEFINHNLLSEMPVVYSVKKKHRVLIVTLYRLLNITGTSSNFRHWNLKLWDSGGLVFYHVLFQSQGKTHQHIHEMVVNELTPSWKQCNGIKNLSTYHYLQKLLPAETFPGKVLSSSVFNGRNLTHI